MPTFSIIIPAYNAEVYIRNCILSVLNQTLQDFEIIAVNDGSRDSTGEILDKFADLDSRISVIHQTNHGPLIARQNGINVATGLYVLFLDSDDYYDCDLLETVSRYSQLGYDMILFRWHYRDKKNQCIDSKSVFAHESIFTNESKKRLYTQLLKSHDLNSLCIKAIKRSLFPPQMFEANEYDGIKNGEDLLQTIPLLMNAEKIIYLDIPLYNYVENNEGTTSSFSASYFQSRIILSKALEDHLNLWGIDSADNRDIIDRRFLLNVVIGIPNSAQIKKVGRGTVLKYLRSVANDELFRKKYKNGVKGLRKYDRAQIFLLYHNHFRTALALKRTRSIISSIRQVLRR